MSAASVYARSAVLWRRVGDEVLLAAPEDAGVYGLSIPASSLWFLLERPQTREDLTRSLAADFEMDPGETSRHVDRLIREMESAGWIVREHRG